MRYFKVIGGRLVMALLAAVLACGSVPAHVAWGVEASQDFVAYDEESGQTVDSADEVADGGSNAKDDAAEVEDSANKQSLTSALSGKATGQSSSQPASAVPLAADESSEPATAAEEEPYSIEATFDGTKLGEGENNLTDVWTTGSKIVSVKLTRNKSVAVDSSKQYVLCMSVPDTLYFNGVPDASKINGIEQAVMVRNAAPKVNQATGLKTIDLPDFSSYSGEIRALLNTSVENVTVEGLGMSFDPRLVGFKVASGSAILNALDIRVVEVDNSLDLSTFVDADATSIQSRKIDSLVINNGGTYNTGSDVRMHLSTDGFNSENSISGSLNMSKDGNVSYALATSAATFQVYKSLKVVFGCPYVEFDADGNGTAEKYYLTFDSNDIALTSNKKGKYSGCSMTGAATYDESSHTVTYTFNNAYLGQYQAFLYTPTFRLPDELKNITIPSNGLKVQRDPWRIVDEQVYAGGASTLLPASRQCAGGVTVVPDSVEVEVVSSAEHNAAVGSGSVQLAKHVIYKELTRANGFSGALGFFDVHNYGVSDAPVSTVSFNFNTDESGRAKYYVTRVNIPFDGNESGTKVNFVLTNGSAEVSGTHAYTNKTSFSVYASTLRADVGVGGDYYIKSLSYEATTLRKNGSFHSDVAHSRRNSTTDYGQFFGYMEGDVGSTASATMTITSTEALNAAGDEKVVSTETSWVGEDDYIGVGFNGNAKVDGGTSQSITAGDTADLTFSFYVTSDEFHGFDVRNDVNYDNGSVNGYHVMRDPVVYICLPNDVSVPGVDQVKLYRASDGKSIKPASVTKLKGSGCTYNGVDAVWWELRFVGSNITTGSAQLSIRLATSSTMNSTNWGFEKAIAVRGDGQQMSWTSQTTCGSYALNTAAAVSKDSDPLIKALGAGLASDPHATDGKLGIVYYTYSVNTTLNIARAEAKLDVDTELSMGSTVSKDLKVTDASSTINYQVDVSSTDGGSAENFNYYIPITKQTATLDSGSFVSQNDYDLQLKKAVSIEDLSGSNGGNPFEVLYTTKEGLDSTAVAELRDGTDDSNEGWVDEDALNGNYGAVTAVLIRTGTRAEVADGASYRFNLALVYDNAGNDFASQAGRVAKWRSFGNYTYTRNGSETTNTYPSQDNSVRLGYVADFTAAPIEIELNTGADSNVATFDRTFDQSFLNDQTMAVKSVTVAGGTSLTSTDPSSLTGSDANSKFLMKLGLNGAEPATLSTGYKGGDSTLAANANASLSGSVAFSPALTDTTTVRYVDVVLGNDDIDVTVRIKLNRTVKAASVAGSGTAVGEQFRTANVSMEAKTIAANSAFTALFDVDGFVPGNFTAQKLAWKCGGVATALPSGATVTMLVLGDSDAVDSMWLWRANGTSSSVDLSQFTRMAGSGNFSYDKASTTATRLKYQFVVSLPAGGAASGDYSLSFEATPVSGATAVSVELPVTLADASGFSLSADGGNVTYGYTESAGDDVRTTGKQLALVLTPAADAKLPADARISANGTEYARNASGYYIVPLGTVEPGSLVLSLISSMADAKGGSYAFYAKLMLAESDDAPMAGSQVDDTSVTLGIAASASPSIRVTGTRVAHKSEWSGGVDFSFDVNGIPDGGSVTVSAFNGLKLTTPATNLMSSVGGVFEVNGGIGTYKGGTSTGKLILNSAVDAGTYRLVFEVKDASGAVLATATHYVVVRN